MNAQFMKDVHFPYWICGICGEWYKDREPADRHCSDRVATSDLSTGRKPLEKVRSRAEMSRPSGSSFISRKGKRTY